jgi:hypothetical protein
VELAIVGDPASAEFGALAAAAAARFVPSLVLAGGTPAANGDIPLLALRAGAGAAGGATAYLCRGYACEAPAADAAALAEQLDRAARG